MTNKKVEFLNFNASRIGSFQRVNELLNFISLYDASFICIQEIDVFSAMRIFKGHFQIFTNYDLDRNSNIGIVTLVKYNIEVLDQLTSLDGRILGIKCKNVQLWNIYPLSGAENKKQRELFFRETLTNIMMNWKDHTKYIFQSGDHNCTYRKQDSLNNPVQHLQQGLISHLNIHGLKDGFTQVHGEQAIIYSRVTNRSSTRIDYIFSNSENCSSFEYKDAGLNFDHKAVISKYSIDINVKKQYIPKKNFYHSWVIPKFLEEDLCFKNDVKDIFDNVWDEYVGDDQNNISFFWEKAKIRTQNLAKTRDKQLKVEEEGRLNVLKIYYAGYLDILENGGNIKEDLKLVKKEIFEIQKNRSKKLVDKMRFNEIDDHIYDIHKLQKERKYENQKTISELKINGQMFIGTEAVVSGIQNKMQEELKPYNDVNKDDPPSMEETRFLDLLPQVQWNEEEINKLTSPTTEEEISQILNFEVDLDSAPGDDGITARFIKLFWGFASYRKLFIQFLNSSRSKGNLGCIDNLGIMVVKNKNTHSIEYNKKRKLTKVNKDSNIGNGKVWTNRMKNVILPKILPKIQFNCQKDINITDEVREIRAVNQHLLGQNDLQIDGTILSIDFNNAYRSCSLRWFNLVLKHFNLPVQFVEWFWMMYNELGIMIVINNFKSDVIKVERGFMEGHPPSMAAFVVAIIPLMVALESEITGVTTNDGVTHKLKAFADDLKLFLENLDEINPCYNIICSFEEVSGLKMHRDPTREKCQALPFGKHKLYANWPEWITVKDSIKIVGVFFSNISGSFELLNTNLVKKNFYNALQKWQGTRGTLYQKVYIVNTFLFSKLWYVAQVVKLDKDEVNLMLRKAMNFIYGGENERPVRVLNFRNTLQGGLGLTQPMLKSKALMIKSMYKEYIQNGWNIGNINNLYGYPNLFKDLYDLNIVAEPVKKIYAKLVDKLISKNESLIPSRNEKRTGGIKWSITWKNIGLLRGVNAAEKIFAWKVSQDMLPIGRRIHRANVEKRCLLKSIDGTECQVVPDIYHAFATCSSVKQSFQFIREITGLFLKRSIDDKNLLFLSFNHRDSRKLKVAIWFVVKSLYLLYIDKLFNKTQLLAEIRRNLDWNIDHMRKIGSLDEMKIFRDILK